MQVLRDYGVTYQGREIVKTVGYAMLACQPYARYGKCQTAVRLLERVDPKAFDDQTKVMRSCQKIKMCSLPQENNAMFIFAMECMALGLLGGGRGLFQS